uniref:Uncharacterized protein n=1 Tax=Kalanchoe fedtschenkoi TaxID=63787 RepID=A0A7N0VCU5_KALFE
MCAECRSCQLVNNLIDQLSNHSTLPMKVSFKVLPFLGGAVRDGTTEVWMFKL